MPAADADRTAVRPSSASPADVDPAGAHRAPDRVALLGLGLIGGSVARALRDPVVGARPTVVAWTPSGRGPAEALAAGVIDAAPADPGEAVRGAELVVLAAPPLACLGMLDALAGPLAAALDPDATITDVASTKGRILARADVLGLTFVGGHPMAGRETSGFGASVAGLLAGRPWFVVPGGRAGDRDIARVTWLATACGATAVRISAAEHDVATAAVSHLPLLVAAALVEAVADVADDGGSAARAAVATAAAGGWRDMSRLARGDPAMGAGILDTNREAVLEPVRRLQAILARWEAGLADPGSVDAAALETWFDAARRRLEDLDRAGRPDP